MSLELGSPFGGNQGNQSLGLDDGGAEQQSREARKNTNGSAEEVACEEPEPEAVAKKPKMSAIEEVPPEEPKPTTQTIHPHSRQDLKNNTSKGVKL